MQLIRSEGKMLSVPSVGKHTVFMPCAGKLGVSAGNMQPCIRLSKRGKTKEGTRGKPLFMGIFEFDSLVSGKITHATVMT